VGNRHVWTRVDSLLLVHSFRAFGTSMATLCTCVVVRKVGWDMLHKLSYTAVEGTMLVMFRSSLMWNVLNVATAGQK
jgi:hypothetical protein